MTKRKSPADFKWEPVVLPENPCKVCDGDGSEWLRRRDGKPDRRYRWPVGPCPACDGSGEEAAA